MCACTVPDLPVADQKMLLNLWHSFYQVFEVVMCEKLRGLFLCNLQQFNMPEKQHFEKKITRRTVQSATWLFVLDFS
jgi:hypothetical protein